jgi:hypothetical protein
MGFVGFRVVYPSTSRVTASSSFLATSEDEEQAFQRFNPSKAFNEYTIEVRNSRKYKIVASVF